VAADLRTALVFTPRVRCTEDLMDSLGRQAWAACSPTAGGFIGRGRGLELRFDFARTARQALDRLASSYYNLVVVDCRHLPGCGRGAARHEEAVFAFLDALRREPDRERRYPFRRVVALVGDSDETRADHLIFAMGERHVGACLRDVSLSAHHGARSEAARDEFVESFWTLCRKVLVERHRGKKAINAAGGGLSGLYYELGVLKCLDDALDIDLRDFDLYYGISAGAMAVGGLATGYSIDDLLVRLGKVDETWPYRLQLSWRHLNLSEIPRRISLVQRELLRYAVRMVKREDELSVPSLLGAWAVMLGPIFDSTEFGEGLRRFFEGSTHGNDFRTLPTRLFIGATDQDRREHVLFGGEGFDGVPISRAVQASCAAHPFFPSVEIDGRYYTDGIVTRTSNVRSAVDHGADLIFVLDPFVPLITNDAGFNARHGNMWIVEQDYKTMSYTRYEQARNELLRRHSRVSIYTFVPSNSMRRLMSGQNPFVSRNFHSIVCEAYKSAYRRLRTIEYKIRGELASHGIKMALAPVEERVHRLADAKRPDAAALLGTVNPDKRAPTAA